MQNELNYLYGDIPTRTIFYVDLCEMFGDPLMELIEKYKDDYPNLYGDKELFHSSFHSRYDYREIGYEVPQRFIRRMEDIFIADALSADIVIRMLDKHKNDDIANPLTNVIAQNDFADTPDDIAADEDTFLTNRTVNKMMTENVGDVFPRLRESLAAIRDSNPYTWFTNSFEKLFLTELVVLQMPVDIVSYPEETL